MSNTTINIEILSPIINKISERLNGYTDKSMQVKNDYYWEVGMSEAFDLNQEPKLSVGSLADDWDSLVKLLEDGSMVTLVDLDRLASVLRAISHHLNPI